LGNISAKNSAQYYFGNNLYLLGKISSNKDLLINALTSFILTGNEKGMEKISAQGISTLQKNIFVELLEWTFTFKGDRSAEIGRLYFYANFAEYIPDTLINKIVEIIISEEKKGYSFFDIHDYGRNSIKALKKIVNRLDKINKIKIIELALCNIQSENRYIYEENLDLLIGIDYKN